MQVGTEMFFRKPKKDSKINCDVWSDLGMDQELFRTPSYR